MSYFASVRRRLLRRQNQPSPPFPGPMTKKKKSPKLRFPPKKLVSTSSHSISPSASSRSDGKIDSIQVTPPILCSQNPLPEVDLDTSPLTDTSDKELDPKSDLSVAPVIVVLTADPEPTKQ